MLLFLQENDKMSLHQKVDKLEREICELNAMIKEILKYKGTQCCDGGESGNHDVYFKDVLETPTTLSGYGITDAIPTSHVSYRITRDLISNWNKAYSLSHSHDNKRILDETTSSFTTELKTKLDNLSNYTLPKATNQRLGGIILGEGLASDENGVVRVTVTGGGDNVEYVLPKASGSVLGGIKVGRNLTIDSDGALHASDPVLGNEYVLPIANSTTLGGFKVGNNLAMTSDGVLNAINTTYDQGSGIKITGTTISVDYSILHEHSNKSILDETTASYTQDEKSKLQTLENFILGKATTTTLGGVMIGEGINEQDGLISIKYGNESNTSVEGNDQRVINGQTAFSWGNHADGNYATTTQLTTKVDKVTPSKVSYALIDTNGNLLTSIPSLGIPIKMLGIDATNNPISTETTQMKTVDTTTDPLTAVQVLERNTEFVDCPNLNGYYKVVGQKVFFFEGEEVL